MNKHAILLMVIVGASLSYYIPKYGLIYDGGLYASLGYSLASDGSYVFNGQPGDVPPLYSLFLAISIFLMGERGVFFVTPIFAGVFIYSLYMLFKREFESNISFLASLLVFLSPPIFFYSINVVRDILLLTFVTLSYLVYLRDEKTRSNEVLLGVCVAFAFLTKYAAFIYLLPLLVHSILNKRYRWVALMTAATLLTPWMAWSKINHDTFLADHSSYLTKDLGREVGRFFDKIFPLLIEWSFMPVVILSIPGIIKKIREDRLNIYFQLLAVTLLVGLLWPEKDIRYVFIAIPFFTYFSIVFISRFQKRYLVAFLLVAIAFQAHATYRLVEANTYSNILFEDAGHWLRDNTPEDAAVLTQSHRQINYFSHRRTYQPPRDVEKVQRYMDYYNVSYVVVDTYEKVTPKYAYTYFDRYTLIKVFKRGAHEIKIYDILSMAENETGTVVEIARWKNNAKAALTLSFDDGYVQTYEAVLPILDEKGIKASFNIITELSGKDYAGIEIMGWEGWGDASLRGHEIASHTITHAHVDEMPVNELEDVLKSSIEQIEENTRTKPISFVYPGGAYDEPSREAVSRSFISARTSDDGYNEYNPEDIHTLKSRTGAFSTASKTKGWIDEAAEKGGWLIINYHLIGDANPSDYPFYLSTAEFRKSIDIFLENGIWVAPQGRVAKYIIERENSGVTVSAFSKCKIALSIKTDLDPEVFNEPLTLLVYLPEKWETASAKQNGGETGVTAYSYNSIQLEALPHAGDIILENTYPCD